VTLALDSGRRVSAHKVILASRSPVFEKMFATQMSEALSSNVALPDAEDHSVDIFLQFLYGGGVEDSVLENGNLICALLQLAHRFQVLDLMTICEDRMAGSLNSENVCQRLRFSDLYQMDVLKKNAISYLTRGDVLPAVKETNGFKTLSADLLAEILLEQSGCGKGRKRACVWREFDDNADWGRLSVAQLKRACLERTLSSHGRKSELIQRLKSHSASKETAPSNPTSQAGTPVPMQIVVAPAAA